MSETFREKSVDEELLTRLFGPYEDIERINRLAKMRQIRYYSTPDEEISDMHHIYETPPEPVIDEWGDND